MPQKRELIVYTEASGSGAGRYTVELVNALSRAEPAALDVSFVGPPQDHTIHSARQTLLPSPRESGKA